MSLCGNHTSRVSKLWVPGCEVSSENIAKIVRIFFSIFLKEMNVNMNVKCELIFPTTLIFSVFTVFFMPRTLIHGDKKAGFTIFWADDGLDTGPILLQRECDVGQNDTVDDLYNRFLFPEGIKAMVCLTVLNTSFLRGKGLESKGKTDKIYAFGKVEVVIFSQILDFTGAVRLPNS